MGAGQGYSRCFSGLNCGDTAAPGTTRSAGPGLGRNCELALGGPRQQVGVVAAEPAGELTVSSPGAAHRVVCTRDGVQIAAYDSGPPDAARTIVLLHGLCLSSQSWSAIVDLLSAGLGESVRIICYDHRGHGRSGQAAAASYNVDQLADDLGDVITGLGVSGSLTLAGHSLGGIVALTYCARARRRQPVRPDGLVLVATAAGQLAQRGLGRLLATPAPDLLAWLVGHAPAAAVDHGVRVVARPACELLARWGGIDAAQRQVLGQMCANALTSTALSTAAGFLSQLRSFDQTSALGQIRACTVVLSGGVDFVTPLGHAEQLVAGIQGAQHRHFPRAGHMLLQQAPREVADAITAAAHAPGPAGAAVTA